MSWLDAQFMRQGMRLNRLESAVIVTQAFDEMADSSVLPKLATTASIIMLRTGSSGSPRTILTRLAIAARYLTYKISRTCIR